MNHSASRGRAIASVFSSLTMAAFSEIGANGGQPRRLPFAQIAVALKDQIASRGNRLVYVKVQNNVNIWRIDLKFGIRPKPARSHLPSAESACYLAGWQANRL